MLQQQCLLYASVTHHHQLKARRTGNTKRNLDEHEPRRQASAFHSSAYVQSMAFKIAFCLQHANEGVHAEEANRIENTQAMNRNIAGEVCFLESEVDARRHLYEQEQHLR